MLIFEFGFELGFELRFALGLELRFELGFELGFATRFEYFYISVHHLDSSHKSTVHNTIFSNKNDIKCV